MVSRRAASALDMSPLALRHARKAAGKVEGLGVRGMAGFYTLSVDYVKRRENP